MEINEKRREIQDEAIDKIIDNNFYCAVIMSTGSGKSFVMLKAMSELMERDSVKSILYTCNSTNLRDADFPNEVKKWGYGNHLKRITRLCYQSAYKLKNQKFDLLLGDEFDFALTPEYIKLLKNNTFKYIVLVSATLTDSKINLLKSLKIPIVYEKSMSELENSGVLNKSKYYYVNFLLNKEENRKYIGYNKALSTLLHEDKPDLKKVRNIGMMRKLFLNNLESSAEICRRLLKNVNSRVLVFSEITNQIDRICEHTYHGKNYEEDKLKDFDSGKIDILGVVGKVDRGVNIDNIRNIIIESCSASKSKIQQKLGRGKRLGINDILNVYILIPFYIPKLSKDNAKEAKPTIILRSIESALADFKIPLIETYKF